MPDHIDDALVDVHRSRPILEQIANKWSVLILTILCPRPVRFSELMRRLDGITHKALADALKKLERNGLITRRAGQAFRAEDDERHQPDPEDQQPADWHQWRQECAGRWCVGTLWRGCA